MQYEFFTMQRGFNEFLSSLLFPCILLITLFFLSDSALSKDQGGQKKSIAENNTNTQNQTSPNSQQEPVKLKTITIEATEISAEPIQ